MEPRKPFPAGRAYASGAKTARPAPVAPVRPESGSRGPNGGANGGVVLPFINPPSSSPRASSSGGNASNRLGWTTSRSPRQIEPPSSGDNLVANASIDFWNDGAPAATTDHTEEDEASQLAYMDHMYTKIQALTAELDREREENRKRAMNVEHQVELRERAALDVLERYGAQSVEESENFETVGAQLPLATSSDTSAAAVNRRFRPHQPRSTSPPQPTALLEKDKLELCSALGKNAELRIRTREIERHAEEASSALEQTQRQMKMVERRIANREEKLRALLKEKIHWHNEMKELREQVVEEKMRQVDLMRRLETTKRETTAQLDAMTQALHDSEEENQALRAYLAETKNQLVFQTKRLDEVMRQARDEKEKLTECIVEARNKFREWKEGEAAAMRAQREQAVNHLKAEYELKITRHQDEKQKLREKVKDLEVSVRLMQKDRSLSPLELSLRKATILGSRDNSGTTEAELIEANVRIKELEALLEHSQEFQKRQENIIKVSEATISRLIQEREVAALDTLANQQLLDGPNRLNSFLLSDPNTPSFESFSATGVAPLSPRQLAAPTRRHFKSPCTKGTAAMSSRPEPQVTEQPFRPVAPPPRVPSVMSPGRSMSKHAPSAFSSTFFVPPSAREERLEEEIKRMEAALQEALAHQQQNDTRRKLNDRRVKTVETENADGAAVHTIHREVQGHSGCTTVLDLHDGSDEMYQPDDPRIRLSDPQMNAGCGTEATGDKEGNDRSSEVTPCKPTTIDMAEETSSNVHPSSFESDPYSNTIVPERPLEVTRINLSDPFAPEGGDDSMSSDNFECLQLENSVETKTIVKVLESGASIVTLDSPIEGVHTSFDASTRNEVITDSKESGKPGAEATDNPLKDELYPSTSGDEAAIIPGRDVDRDNRSGDIPGDVEEASHVGNTPANATTPEEQLDKYPGSCLRDHELALTKTKKFVDLDHVDDGFPETPEFAGVVDKEDLSDEKSIEEENIEVSGDYILGSSERAPCSAECTTDAPDHEVILSLAIRLIAQRVVEEVQEAVVKKVSSDVKDAKGDHGGIDRQYSPGSMRCDDSCVFDPEPVRQQFCSYMVNEVIQLAVHTVKSAIMACRLPTECEEAVAEEIDYEALCLCPCADVEFDMDEAITETMGVDLSCCEDSSDPVESKSAATLLSQTDENCAQSDRLDLDTTVTRVMATALMVATSAQVVGIMSMESICPSADVIESTTVELERQEDLVGADNDSMELLEDLPNEDADGLFNTPTEKEPFCAHSSQSNQTIEDGDDSRLQGTDSQLQSEQVPQTIIPSDNVANEATACDTLEANSSIAVPSCEPLSQVSPISDAVELINEKVPLIATSAVDACYLPPHCSCDSMNVDVDRGDDLHAPSASVEEFSADRGKVNRVLTENSLGLSHEFVGSAKIAGAAADFVATVQNAAIQRVINTQVMYRTSVRTHLEAHVTRTIEEGIAAFISQSSSFTKHVNSPVCFQDEVSAVEAPHASENRDHVWHESERDNSANGDNTVDSIETPVVTLVDDPVIQIQRNDTVPCDERLSLEDQVIHPGTAMPSAPPKLPASDASSSLGHNATHCGMTTKSEEDESVVDVVAGVVELVEKSVINEPTSLSPGCPKEVAAVLDVPICEFSSEETRDTAGNGGDFAPMVIKPEYDDSVRLVSSSTDNFAYLSDTYEVRADQDVDAVMMAMLNDLQRACDVLEVPLLGKGTRGDQHVRVISSTDDMAGIDVIPRDAGDSGPNSCDNFDTAEATRCECTHSNLPTQMTILAVETYYDSQFDASSSAVCEPALQSPLEEETKVAARDVLADAIEVIVAEASLECNTVGVSDADDDRGTSIENQYDATMVETSATASIDEEFNSRGPHGNAGDEQGDKDPHATQIMSLVDDLLSAIEHENQVYCSKCTTFNSCE